jgi:hypothetical protein
MSDTTWYSVYECDDADGYDSDYMPFNTKEEAIAAAKSYLEFAGGIGGEIFVIPVPTEWYASLPEDAEWSLWDEMERIPASDYIWIHCGRERAEIRAEQEMPLPKETTDIVADMREMAYIVHAEMSEMLTNAADEITRLREQVNETHRIINEQNIEIIKMMSAKR